MVDGTQAPMFPVPGSLGTSPGESSILAGPWDLATAHKWGYDPTYK